MMKIFKATFEEVLHYNFYVEAESEDEAMKVIDKMGNEAKLDFDSCNAEFRFCDIISVSEVKERS